MFGNGKYMASVITLPTNHYSLIYCELHLLYTLCVPSCYFFIQLNSDTMNQIVLLPGSVNQTLSGYNFL